MSSLPDKITDLAAAVRAEGGRALLVGGCVRDELMGREAKDWDLEVYGIESGRLRKLLDQFGEVNVVGEAFTVYKLGTTLMFRCRGVSEKADAAIADLLLKATRR